VVRKKRKSPFKHHVKKHVRKGKPVTDYERGKGNQPKKPTMGHKPQNVIANYRVNVKYVSNPTESFNFQVPDAPTAIGNALIIKRSIEEPLELEAIRP